MSKFITNLYSAIYRTVTTPDTRRMDRVELLNIVEKHGEQTEEVLRQRMNDKRISNNSRRHWRRLLWALLYLRMSPRPIADLQFI